MLQHFHDNREKKTVNDVSTVCNEERKSASESTMHSQDNREAHSVADRSLWRFLFPLNINLVIISDLVKLYVFIQTYTFFYFYLWFVFILILQNAIKGLLSDEYMAEQNRTESNLFQSWCNVPLLSFLKTFPYTRPAAESKNIWKRRAHMEGSFANHRGILSLLSTLLDICSSLSELFFTNSPPKIIFYWTYHSSSFLCRL